MSRLRLKAGTYFPPGQSGRIVLLRSNSQGAVYRDPTEIEWFPCSSIASSGGWCVPETVNGFFYAHDE